MLLNKMTILQIHENQGDYTEDGMFFSYSIILKVTIVFYF